MLKTNTVVRKPIYAEEVRVTVENIHEVAEWCGGTILSSDKIKHGPNIYVAVDSVKPMNERQKMAFVGDHVLKSETGFKVYTHRSFEKSFDTPDEELALRDRNPEDQLLLDIFAKPEVAEMHRMAGTLKLHVPDPAPLGETACDTEAPCDERFTCLNHQK